MTNLEFEGAIDLEQIEITDTEDSVYVKMILSSEQAKTIGIAIEERLSAGQEFHIYGLAPGARQSAAKVLHPTAFIVIRKADVTGASLIASNRLVINLEPEIVSDFTYSIETGEGTVFFHALPNVVFQLYRTKPIVR